MKKNITEISFGANISPKDKRNIQFSDLTFTGGELYIKGGKEYLASDIEHQHKVGICTAIHLIQNRQKANNKKYSADFQYLLQKKYLDNNWYEGSSIYSSLKVGYNYGFLELKHWTYTTEADRFLSYDEYIAKLQSIPEKEIKRLIKLCIDKIGGYAWVDISDEQQIAKAITNSKAGILCRFAVDKNWWTSVSGVTSWAEKDLSPLRPPVIATSGHAIIGSNFDFSIQEKLTLANTWGSTYCRNGSIDTILSKYKPTEVWSINEKTIITKFTETIKLGMSGSAVQNLQNALKIKGYFTVNSTGYFGLKTWYAVKKFQKANGLVADGIVGKKTNNCLNKLFSV